MATKEGRLSRWSRLKHKGGVSVREESVVSVELQRQPDSGRGSEGCAIGDGSMVAPNPASLPGGDFRHNDIPVMAPLAGVEDDDTKFEAAPEEALALLSGDLAHDTAPVVSPVDGNPAPFDEAERDLSDEELEIVAELPAVDSLTKESDFTPFLADKVPEFIRRRALSVLWRSDPVLANIDGLNDYDEDFNIIDTLIDIAKDTNYRVGKGMVHDDDEDEDGTDESTVETVEESVDAEGRAEASEGNKNKTESVEGEADSISEKTEIFNPEADPDA